MTVERSFNENLTQILGGVYGSDIRLAIHDALMQAYNHSESTTESVTSGTMDSFTAALCYVLGLSATKTYDTTNKRYIYTLTKVGEGSSSTGYMPIDDSITVNKSTWSSQKINSEIQALWNEFDAIGEELSEL